MGIMGSGHCFAMCGGIAAALTFGQSKDKGFKSVCIIALYNIGRMLGYVVIAVLASTALAWIPEMSFPYARVLVGLVLILVGLSFMNVWQGIRILERLGAIAWRRIKPFGDRFLPIDSGLKALLVGVVWGWLPCGLVYAALTYSIAQPTGWYSAGAMLAFGLGTFPAVFLSGLFATKVRGVLGNKSVRFVSGVALLCFAIWTIASPFVYPHNHGDGGHDHAHHH